jgi:hypothetical protein
LAQLHRHALGHADPDEVAHGDEIGGQYGGVTRDFGGFRNVATAAYGWIRMM